jgi:Double zinc ribbon
MTVAIGFFMVLAVAVYVAMPFFTGETGGSLDSSAPVSASERQNLERQKAEAYAAIKEIEFDYRMGKLSDADFKGIRNKFAAEALATIAALDAAKPTPVRGRSEGRRSGRIAFCPSCGRSAPPRANFCPACGRTFKEEAVA